MQTETKVTTEKERIVIRTDTSKIDVSKPEEMQNVAVKNRMTADNIDCLLYTSPSPRDRTRSRMPSSA